MDEGEPVQTALALETAIGWLDQSKPLAILKIFRNPDFAHIGEAAFAGFRVNAAGFARPLVRQRLAREAVRNEKFAETLRECADQSAAVAPLPHLPPLPSLPPPAKVRATLDADSGRSNALRTERDRLRRERDEAKSALADAESARRESEKRRRQAEIERDSATQLAGRHAQRIARLERQVAKLKIEQDGLRRATRRASVHDNDLPSNPPNTSSAIVAPPATPRPPDNLWADAVARLLDKRQYDMASKLAEDILRADPGNIDAIEIAARAFEGLDDLQRAVSLFRRLLAARLAKGERGEAGEVFLRLLALAPDDIEKDLRTYLSGLRVKDNRSIEQARALFARLHGIAPESYASANALIPKLASKQLALALTMAKEPAGLDIPLPLGLPENISAHLAALAAARGDVEQVSAVREALARLKKNDAAAYQQAQKALAQAADEDQALLIPILGGKTRGPIIVDGSNVAWYDQESLAQGRPRLQPLLNLRQALRARGYFPILLFGDANLPYVIDDTGTLSEMIARREITLVDSGVDADEVIIRQAKHYNAPVVTNDYMDDWDPLREVVKIRYAISLKGEPMLLYES